MTRLLFGRYPFSFLLAFVFAVIAAVCLSANYLIWTKYRVTSLVRAPENISAYRELVPQAWKSTNVERYAKSIEGLSAAQRQRLIALTDNLESGVPGSVIEPQFAFENKERKDLAGFIEKTGQDRTDLLLFLGTKIQTRHRSPTQALQDNQLLVHAFRDVLLYEELARFARNENNKLIKDKTDLEAKQVEQEQLLISLERKINDLEALRAQYPDRNTTVQLVNPNDTAYRYLPLRDQIVAFKSEQTDIKDQVKKLQWQLTLLQLKQNFLEAFSKDFAQAQNGAAAFEQFEKQTRQLASYPDTYKEMLPIWRAELNQKIQRWRNDYLSNTSIAVESSAPAKKDFPWLILVLTAIFAALIGGFLELLNAWVKKLWQEE